MIRLAAFLAVFMSALPLAEAAEVINSFDVSIRVEQNGDILVTETIRVRAEGEMIRRGIFRDLPRYYKDQGARLPYEYTILDVRRDGTREPYTFLKEDNAVQIRIGNANVFLETGDYTYTVTYRVGEQVRFFDTHDELYWNATGTYWAFSILQASAEITLPEGAQVTEAVAYTGAQGGTDQSYAYRQNGRTHLFETTAPLGVREGITVALLFNKGVIQPPSPAELRARWWQRYGPLFVLFGSLIALLAFYYRSFDAVGRDPVKPPVFPRYAPPEGYSPAAVHYIYHRSVSGHKALIATFLHMATNGLIRIDQVSKKKTRSFLKLSQRRSRNCPRKILP